MKWIIEEYDGAWRPIDEESWSPDEIGSYIISHVLLGWVLISAGPDAFVFELTPDNPLHTKFGHHSKTHRFRRVAAS